MKLFVRQQPEFWIAFFNRRMLAPVIFGCKHKSDIPAADNFAALVINRLRGTAHSANPWTKRQPVTDGAWIDAGRAC